MPSNYLCDSFLQTKRKRKALKSNLTKTLVKWLPWIRMNWKREFSAFCCRNGTQLNYQSPSSFHHSPVN